MPVNRSLARALIKKYGSKKGKSIYYGMETKNSKGFRKGLKTAKREGHIAKKFPTKRKRSKK